MFLKNQRSYFRARRFDVATLYLYLAAVLMLLSVWDAKADSLKPGGEGSVAKHAFWSFSQPMANLDSIEKSEFYAGRALAQQPWVKAPSSTTSRDGLGPLYNARTCLACHINGGRGVLPESGKIRITQGLVRLSIPGENPVLGVVPEPTYGDQLQTQSTALAHQLSLSDYSERDVRPEAYVYIDWQFEDFNYPDGTHAQLRKPNLRIENLGYGALDPNVLISFRNAPALHGTGLLEQIAEADLLHNIEQQQKRANLSGRINQVWNPETQKAALGRMGWKANKPSVKVQSAAAFQGDVGISNPLFPKQPCEAGQKNCLHQINGNDHDGFEISGDLLDKVAYFVQHIGVPESRNSGDAEVVAGKKLFAEAGCVNCHRPSYITKKNSQFPRLSEQEIWPYTDLLLHDMGEALADHRPDFLATGREWRTPPLWGVGISQAVNGSGLLLHDGRARSVEEAILWHGGEAAASKDKFIHFSKSERESVIKFVESL